MIYDRTPWLTDEELLERYANALKTWKLALGHAKAERNRARVAHWKRLISQRRLDIPEDLEGVFNGVGSDAY